MDRTTLLSAVDHSLSHYGLSVTPGSGAEHGWLPGVWGCHVGQNKIWFDRRSCEILGLAEADLPGNLDEFIRCVEVSQRERVRGLFQQRQAWPQSVSFSLQRQECASAKVTLTLRGNAGDDSPGIPLFGILEPGNAVIQVHNVLALEKSILSAAAFGAGLREVLEIFALGLEESWEGMRCAVNLHDPDERTLHFGAAPSLPPAYAQVVEGFQIDSLPSVCGKAIKSGQFACVDDFSGNTEFQPTREIYTSLGVASCWSMPVRTSTYGTLATFCLLFDQPRMPTLDERHLIERLARILEIVVIRDAQEKQRIALESRMNAIHKLESLGLLAGGIAHDFNNLLTAIRSYAELIRIQASQDEQIVEFAGQICSATDFAADLCKQMLTYAGKHDAQRAPVALVDVVQEVVRIVTANIPPQVQIQVTAEPRIPDVLGDKSMLAQIALNLLTNAIEAVGQQAGRISIAISSREMSGQDLKELYSGSPLMPGPYVQLQVSDSGCGIKQVNLDRLFDPFYTTKSEGKGLGLATVFGMVCQHHGGILVRSKLGRGTSFVVCLPAQGDAAASDNPPRVAGPEETSRERSVLIVDDEERVRESLSRLFHAIGYQVACSDSGEAAIHRITELDASFDVIVLDQTMPGMNGVQTYRKLRAMNCETPVCFVTGYPAQQELQTALRTGIDTALVPKPFDFAQLVSSVERLALSRGRKS